MLQNEINSTTDKVKLPCLSGYTFANQTCEATERLMEGIGNSLTERGSVASGDPVNSFTSMGT